MAVEQKGHWLMTASYTDVILATMSTCTLHNSGNEVMHYIDPGRRSIQGFCPWRTKDSSWDNSSTKYDAKKVFFTVVYVDGSQVKCRSHSTVRVGGMFT